MKRPEKAGGSAGKAETRKSGLQLAFLFWHLPQINFAPTILLESESAIDADRHFRRKEDTYSVPLAPGVKKWRVSHYVAKPSASELR